MKWMHNSSRMRRRNGKGTAKFEEDTRLLCETHEREELDRTIPALDKELSFGASYEEYRKTTGNAPPGQWFTVGSAKDVNGSSSVSGPCHQGPSLPNSGFTSD
eukprot:3175705-Karenia_brevis.AAC.1